MNIYVGNVHARDYTKSTMITYAAALRYVVPWLVILGEQHMHMRSLCSPTCSQSQRERVVQSYFFLPLSRINFDTGVTAVVSNCLVTVP